jgi:hypothetical protein
VPRRRILGPFSSGESKTPCDIAGTATSKLFVMIALHARIIEEFWIPMYVLSCFVAGLPWFSGRLFEIIDAQYIIYTAFVIIHVDHYLFMLCVNFVFRIRCSPNVCDAVTNATL